MNMESLYNPIDTLGADEYFQAISEVTANSAWMEFYFSLKQVCAASSIKLLKLTAETDIDMALRLAKLSQGYKHALSEYLAPFGKKPFVFVQPATSSRSPKSENKLWAKKFDSQKNRPSLGNEMGPKKLQEVEFPDGLFKGISHSREVPMHAKGKHGAEEVSNRVWSWDVAKWGNLHVDQPFCDHMETLLSKRWPHLKDWSGKARSWSGIIRHRFGNARGARPGSYKSSTIPTIDLTSPAKRLLKDEKLNFLTDDSAPSMFGSPIRSAAPAPSPSLPIATVATGRPVRDTDDTGVHVARGVAVTAAAAPSAGVAPSTSTPLASSTPQVPPSSPAPSEQMQEESDDEELERMKNRRMAAAAAERWESAAAAPATSLITLIVT
jgi:hypothetical protein